MNHHQMTQHRLARVRGGSSTIVGRAVVLGKLRGDRASNTTDCICQFERLEGRAMLSAVPVFKVTNLVSDGSVSANFTDTNLKNPWGISFNPSANVVWIADNDTGVSTVYNPDGSVANTGFYSSITIPTASGTGTGSPDGQLFNDTSAFSISKAGVSGAADYLWATEDGTISGWNPNVDPTNALIEVNDSSSNAKFFGITQASVKGTNYLYAADLSNGKVDMFDTNFAAVKFKNAFTDPSLPKGYAPWNVQNVDDNIVVTYVKQNSTKTFAATGASAGIVDIYSPKGVLIKELARGGSLNAPWGVTQAPATYGAFANDLLVGNFGDGRILAYNMKTGHLDGFLENTHGESLKFPGLWGLTFGDNTATANTLFFTDGPSKTTGLFATLTLSHKPKTAATPVSTPAPTPPSMPGLPVY